MAPAIRPALQLVTAEGGRDLLHLAGVERQRQRAVLEDVGQAGGLGLA